MTEAEKAKKAWEQIHAMAAWWYLERFGKYQDLELEDGKVRISKAIAVLKEKEN